MTVSSFFSVENRLTQRQRQRKYLEVLGNDLRQKTSRERSVKTGLFSVYKLMEKETVGIFWFQVLKVLASFSYFML